MPPPQLAAPPQPKPAPKPQPPVVRVPIEPAHPNPDSYRESWGKIERLKPPAQTANDKPAQPATPRVAPFPAPKVAMQAPPQSNMSGPNAAAMPSDAKKSAFSGLFGQSKPAAPAVETPPPSPSPNVSMQGNGRVISMPANEANAFWTPPTAPTAKEQSRFNAFDRGAAPPRPPRGMVYASPTPMPPPGPRYTGPLPPPGPYPRYPSPPMPPQPPRYDVGVAEGMGNAFTLAGTSRPIPADFGGTPQEPNGFGNAIAQMEGQGSPPRAYSMGVVPNYPRPPLPVNPYANVPPRQTMNPALAAAPARPEVARMLAVLKDSLYPSQREWAAEQLSESNWRTQPNVVESLMASARQDRAATVRVACLRALTRMKVSVPQTAALVRQLKDDRDPRVRHQAEEAMVTLGIAAPQAESVIVPAARR